MTMKHIVIPRGEGVKTHSPADPSNYNLSDNAEIYDTKDEFRARVDELRSVRGRT